MKKPKVRALITEEAPLVSPLRNYFDTTTFGLDGIGEALETVPVVDLPPIEPPPPDLFTEFDYGLLAAAVKDIGTVRELLESQRGCPVQPDIDLPLEFLGNATKKIREVMGG